MKVIVTGGRDHLNRQLLYKVLDTLKPNVVIQGGASGADFSAKCWATHHCVHEETYEADWNTHGKAAGPIRNKLMCEENRDAVVVAFKGGRGTENCICNS